METDEARRIKALQDYRVLDTAAEEVFDSITELASAIFKTPIALVSLIDEQRQWFKSKVGLEVSETPRSVAFCDHAIRGNETMVVPDATQDPRFKNNPLVVNEPFVRFYCGVPLRTPEGHNLGTLCLIDKKPRTISERERRGLEALARQVEAGLEMRRRLVLLEESLETQRATQQSRELLASMLVHDLRGPLTTITLIASGLHTEGPALEQDLEDLVLEAERSQRMLTDVLGICLYGLGQLRLRRVRLVAGPLLTAVARRVAARARVRKQTVRVEPSTEDLNLDADPELLGRVIENLLTNAMQHGPVGGEIVASASRVNGSVRFEVRDQGKPLSPEARVAVFAPFESGAGPHGSHGMRNVGLGLTFCRMAVEAHGGRVAVEPGASGGNCFFVELPIDASA